MGEAPVLKPFQPLPPIAHAWDAALVAAEADGDRRPTWAHEWPAGLRLTQALPELLAHWPLPLAQTRCCDLGCGRGLLGMALLHYGMGEVSFADGSPHPLAFVQAMLEHYHLAGQGQSYHCQCHQWGTPLDHGPYDLIVGGDILYRPECFPELLLSIQTSLQPQGVAWLSDPRHSLEKELPQLAEEAGLTWQQQRLEAHAITLVQVSLA